jgi:SH3 domain-containing protein
MSGNYIQCSECGKRALRIATRCPQCGREFVSATPDEPRPLVDPEHHPAILAAAATALLALALGVGWWARRPPVDHGSTTALIRPDTTSVSGSATAAEPMERMPQQRRFARTWTKVHTGRSIGSEIAAVLLPGDTVVVDSLQRGWWRVALGGEVLGYVSQSTLQTQPPSSTPP